MDTIGKYNVLLGVVILNYNTYTDTIELVGRLQHQTISGHLHIVVVDNASPNGSYGKLKALAERYANVTVLQTDANLGYARGNNFGLTYLEEHVDPRYVAILNNDILLPDDCFERLMNGYDTLHRPAFISPVMLDKDGKTVHPPRKKRFIDDCLDMFILYRLMFTRVIKIDANARHAIRVEMIPGSFMFSSFEVFRQLGYFYPGTFLFTEERFMAEKTTRAGLNNYLILCVHYVHRHSTTINSVFDKARQFRYRYDGILKYTEEFRKNGRWKAMILRPLMAFSLLEIRVIFGLFRRTV